MPFGNTEIWFSELAGLGRDRRRFECLWQEELALLSRTVNKLNLIIHLYGTRLSRREWRIVAESLFENRTKIRRLVFVGVGFLGQFWLKRILFRRRGLGFRLGFDQDYEKAKLEVVR